MNASIAIQVLPTVNSKEELIRTTGGKYNCPLPDHIQPTLDL